MKKYLVIGASGLVGSHLICELQKKYFLYGVSRKKPLINSHNFTWIKHDLLAPITNDLLPCDIDAIIYLAQSEHFRDFPHKSGELLNVNVVRYLEILDFAVKNRIKKVIYASSGGVYGQGMLPFCEQDSISVKGDLGFYLGSKICSEVLSGAYNKLLDIIILRFFFIYGPNQKDDMLIPRLFNNVKNQVPVKISGHSGIKINPLYVTDAISAIIKAISLKGSDTFNVAGLESFSIKNIVRIMGEIIGIEPIYKYSENFLDADIIGDISKLKNKGWMPRVSLQQGLEAII